MMICINSQERSHTHADQRKGLTRNKALWDEDTTFYTSVSVSSLSGCWIVKMSSFFFSTYGRPMFIALIRMRWSCHLYRAAEACTVEYIPSRVVNMTLSGAASRNLLGTLTYSFFLTLRFWLLLESSPPHHQVPRGQVASFQQSLKLKF